MRGIEERLRNLEPKQANERAHLKHVVLDGTKTEVATQRASLPKDAQHILTELVPHLGESFNDFRRSIGLAPLDEPQPRGMA
jgi:hypothetical protein